jgi:hypothetical protein
MVIYDHGQDDLAIMGVENMDLEIRKSLVLMSCEEISKHQKPGLFEGAHHV